VQFLASVKEAIEAEVPRDTLVHPQRVKAIASAKLKNDRVDSQTLAAFIPCDLLPEAGMAIAIRKHAVSKCVYDYARASIAPL